MTNQLLRHGFLSPENVEQTVAQEHHAAIIDTNGRLARILNNLMPKTAEVKASDGLTPRGKADRLRALAEKADRDAIAVMKQKHAAVQSWLVEAENSIASALSPAQPDRVREVREDVRLLIRSRPQVPNSSQFMKDSEGRVVVTGQDPVVDSLLTAASQGDLEAGKLAVAAVRFGSPVLQGLVGGKPVINEMVRRLTERVARPALARKASLESLRSVLDNNAARTHTRILELTGLAAVHAEDPIAESAAGA